MSMLFAPTRAEAIVTVRRSESTSYAKGPGPELVELRIDESFSGDIEGDSIVRALEVRRGKDGARLVSLQRVHGRLGGREGSFVLQGEGKVANGSIKSSWFVVPGSGTGALAGLTGEGGFEGEFGKGSHATLDYWFE